MCDDGKGVDLVERLKVVKVREEGIRSEHAVWHVDENMTSVLEEFAFTHAKSVAIVCARLD